MNNKQIAKSLGNEKFALEYLNAQDAQINKLLMVVFTARQVEKQPNIKNVGHMRKAIAILDGKSGIVLAT